MKEIREVTSVGDAVGVVSELSRDWKRSILLPCQSLKGGCNKFHSRSVCKDKEGLLFNYERGVVECPDQKGVLKLVPRENRSLNDLILSNMRLLRDWLTGIVKVG